MSSEASERCPHDQDPMACPYCGVDPAPDQDRCNAVGSKHPTDYCPVHGPRDQLPDQEARAERCPTCGSDDPDTCRLNHHHHPWTVVPRAVGRKYCCPDSFHAPPERCPECKAEWIGGYRVHEEGCFYGEQEADVSPIAPDQEARAEKCGGSGEVPVTLYGDEYPETGFRTTGLCPGCPDCTPTPPDQDGAMLFEVEAVLDDLHPDLRDENTADWLRRALRAREARAEQLERDLATAERQREEANEELLMARIRAANNADLLNEALQDGQYVKRLREAREQAEAERDELKGDNADLLNDAVQDGQYVKRLRTELATLHKQVAEHVEWLGEQDQGRDRSAVDSAYRCAADHARQILEAGE